MSANTACLAMVKFSVWQFTPMRRNAVLALYTYNFTVELVEVPDLLDPPNTKIATKDSGVRIQKFCWRAELGGTLFVFVMLPKLNSRVARRPERPLVGHGHRHPLQLGLVEGGGVIRMRPCASQA